MLSQLKKLIVCVCVLSLLPACSTVPGDPELKYSKSLRQSLAQLQDWSFEGRVAVTGKNDSWSASMSWVHRQDREVLKLSGPLGQGAVVVSLMGDKVTIDRGNGDVRSSNNAEEFINQELGLFVPLKFLSFWVVGIPRSDVSFNETADGFTQEGWLNEYNQMQAVNMQVMPRKMTVTNGQAKLKLIIDQWHLGNIHEK